MVDAGGGVNKTLNAERPEVTSQLRVLYQTPGVASHPFSVHPRVPQTIREKITQTWFKFAQQDSGKEILNAVHFKKSVTANFEQDYKPLDGLRLEKYVPQH
jgi:phosphonate transport system substrate-binding protein